MLETVRNAFKPKEIRSRIIYTLVGLAGLWCVSLLFRRQNHVGIAD